MTRRDILGPDTSYEPGGGYAGLLTTRETVKALLIAGPLLAVVVLVQIYFSDRRSTDVSRVVFAIGLVWLNARTLLNPDADRADADEPPRTPIKRAGLRVMAAIALAVGLGLAADALFDLLTPHPISAAE